MSKAKRGAHGGQRHEPVGSDERTRVMGAVLALAAKGTVVSPDDLLALWRNRDLHEALGLPFTP